MGKKKSGGGRRAPQAPPPPIIARADPTFDLGRPHAASALTDGPEPILEAVKLATSLGHKTDRRGSRIVMCWHCEHSGILLCNGERNGNIFTDRCPGIVRPGA